MNKIKLINPIYAEFNDYIGSVKFKDGVSEVEVSNAQANLISGVGYEISFVDEEVQHDLTTFKFEEKEFVLEKSCKTEEELGDDYSQPEQVVTKAIQSSYTREELEAIADAKGIKGLREIADALDVKGKSVEALIDGILGL